MRAESSGNLTPLEGLGYCEMTRFLGLDPGYDRCGWGIVDDDPALVNSGVIQTDKEWSYWKRLNAVYNAIVHIISQYDVEVVGVEKPYAGEKVGKRVLEVGGVWGVIGLAIHNTGCEYLELSNSHIKAAVANGRGTKEEVRHGVETILRITLKGHDDESDGLACAICARDDYQLAQMIKDSNER